MDDPVFFATTSWNTRVSISKKNPFQFFIWDDVHGNLCVSIFLNGFVAWQVNSRKKRLGFEIKIVAFGGSIGILIPCGKIKSEN